MPSGRDGMLCSTNTLSDALVVPGSGVGGTRAVGVHLMVQGFGGFVSAWGWRTLAFDSNPPAGDGNWSDEEASRASIMLTSTAPLAACAAPCDLPSRSCKRLLPAPGFQTSLEPEN